MLEIADFLLNAMGWVAVLFYVVSGVSGWARGEDKRYWAGYIFTGGLLGSSFLVEAGYIIFGLMLIAITTIVAWAMIPDILKLR